MTTNPTEPVTPFWQVQAVFDDDADAGQDFAYTIGLHRRGLPELHLWARPSLGEDPGEDWKLSMRDQRRILNELGGMLVAGDIGVGSEVRKDYDHGLAHVTFRVDPPGDREQLEAYGIAAGAKVLPVRWSLEREPDGPLRPLDALARRRATRLYDEIVAGLDRQATAPPGWALPAVPDFDETQRFGPLTPVVLARAAQLWQGDDEAVVGLLRASAREAEGYSLTEPAAVAVALARPVGRRAALAGLHRAALGLVDRLTDDPDGAERWRDVVRSTDPTFWKQADRPVRRSLGSALATLLREITVTCLLVEAVADVAEPALLLEGRGAWLSGVRGEPVLSHPAWQASARVQETVRGLLEPLDWDGLTYVGALHAVAMRGGVRGAPDYHQVCGRLQSWALVSAACCPWEGLLARLPGWRELMDKLPNVVLAPVPELHEWATCVTSALTHRARLSTDDVLTFAAPFQALLPQLPAVLDQPL